METHELKAAWQAIDKRFERENRLTWQLLRDQRLDKVRSSLWPLIMGQCLQMLFGIVFILLAVLLWNTSAKPVATMIAGIVVHAYGVIVIITAGVVLGKLRSVDYAAPVLAIQKQLAQVRRYYVISGMIAGLPWWFMWVPVLMVLIGLTGVDLYAHTPGTVWSGIAVGAIGLLSTALFHRWSRSSKRPKLARYMEDSVTGSSLRKAQLQLSELQRFEED